MNILEKCRAWAGKQRKQTVILKFVDKNDNLLYTVNKTFFITEDDMDWEIPIVVDKRYKPFEYSYKPSDYYYRKVVK